MQELKGSVSYLQTCRTQVIPAPHREVRRKWLLAISHSFRTSFSLNPWQTEVGFEASEERSVIDLTPRVCEVWGCLMRQYRAVVKSEFRSANLGVSLDAASYQLSHQGQITQPLLMSGEHRPWWPSLPLGVAQDQSRRWVWCSVRGQISRASYCHYY